MIKKCLLILVMFMSEYALHFSGAGKITIADAPRFLTPFGAIDLSVEFIARTSRGGHIFDSFDVSAGRGLRIYLNNVGRPEAAIRTSTMGSVLRVWPLESFVADTWHHYVLSIKNNYLRWYIDGEQKELDIDGGVLHKYITPGGIGIVNPDKYIGVFYNNLYGPWVSYFTGDIRNFGYYKARGLSGAEVIARYSAVDFSGSEPNLSVAYNMNEGEGLTVTDILGDTDGLINSSHYVSWLELSPPPADAEFLQKKIAEAIKTKFDDAEFTYIDNLYFEQAPQDADLDYTVFHWIDSTERHLMGGTLESVTIQFNVYMNAVDDIGATIQELADTFDWCDLDIPGYDHIVMKREFTRNMQYIEDVWQIVLAYEILVHY